MASAKLIPLKDAPWAFASPRLRVEWQRVQDAPSSSKASKLDPASTDAFRKLAAENPAEAFEWMAEGFNEIIEDLRVRSVPELAMQETLLEKLRDGRLEAWGVEAAPERRRDLEMLPPHLFIDAKISWNKNSVTSLGATYNAVQIRRRPSAMPRTTEKALSVPADISSTILSKRADQSVADASHIPVGFQGGPLTQPPDQESSGGKRRTPGPPSGEAEVIATYNKLFEEGLLSEGMTTKEIHNKLLPHLKRNSKIFPNGRGLAYSSIARHLRPHLRSKFSS
jgi:hypothetical protein